MSTEPSPAAASAKGEVTSILWPDGAEPSWSEVGKAAAAGSGPTPAPDLAPDHSNASARSLDLFRRAWQTYRLVLNHNLMEHRQLTAALQQALGNACQRLRSDHPTRPLELIDLGCGDLALLPPVYAALPLDRFLGLDASPPVLPLARAALGPTPFASDWICADLSAWAQEPDGAQLALVVSCFALHHLDTNAKRRVLAGLRRRLLPGGVLLLADMFRHDGDSHSQHMRRNLARIRGWAPCIGAAASAELHAHVAASDLPEDLDAFLAEARATGWRAKCLWTDDERLEALLQLEPLD